MGVMEVWDYVNNIFRRLRGDSSGRAITLPEAKYEATPPSLSDGDVHNFTLTSDGKLRVDVSSITLDVDIVAQTVGNITVDIAAQSVGNINIDIAAQSVGNLNVDIKAQTVDLNIKTSGGTNIVIDKLTQAAYTERRVTLINQGAAASWLSSTDDERRGKFFPRGCRGFIYQIGVYCRDTAAAGGTITVYLAPYIGAGYLYSATVTVEAGGDATWRFTTLDKMWNYDSMFIFAVCSAAAIQMGYDSDTPHDAFYSSDAGATWVYSSLRFWFRVLIKAQTVGDIPVSGTLNTVKLPYASERGSFTAIPIPDSTETSIGSQDGGGYCDWMLVEVTDSRMEIRVYCDGTLAWSLDPDTLNAIGYGTTTPIITQLGYNNQGACAVQLGVKFEFTRKIEVKSYHETGVEEAATLTWTVNLVK